MMTTFLLTALAFLLAAPIAYRCICVGVKVSGQRFAEKHSAHLWHGFAISYIALGGASGFAVLNVYRTGGSTAVWMFLVASAGLVLFDPRRPS